jgi:N-acetylglucosaminyldiphosphoundecaprenol N-acetyl-beta-D-mannosaminyltransferase
VNVVSEMNNRTVPGNTQFPTVKGRAGDMPERDELVRTQPPVHILGMKVNPTTYARAAALVRAWAEQGASKYVCLGTVNHVMEAYDSSEFRRVVNNADLVTPDGMPLVWALRLLGHKNASRVYGPDLTPILLQMAAESGLAVGFYGGAPEALRRLLEVVAQRFPKLRVAYSFSPPFRPLTPQEDEQVVAAINASGVRILFIGLNTPKQDYWMAAHKAGAQGEGVQAVMAGVGAAFDFLAGAKPQAPRWMMPLGLEWLFRLATEPRRLWKRYLKHNPRYVALLALQLLRHKSSKPESAGAPPVM